jgi:hypothetical protein
MRTFHFLAIFILPFQQCSVSRLLPDRKLANVDTRNTGDEIENAGRYDCIGSEKQLQKGVNRNGKGNLYSVV